MNERDLMARYPRLFEPTTTMWKAEMRFVLELGPPPPHLVSNVRIVGFDGDRTLAIRTEEFGWGLLPGGTLEPGESVLEGLQRELREEAGARALSFEPFAGVHFWSGAPDPYRPHIPHPEFYWLIGYGDVEIVGEPAIPEDGETVLEVRTVSIDEAAMLAAEAEDLWQLDLVRLARDIRS